MGRLEDELRIALVQSDPADRKDVIVEVRQGVGGDEAALWAGDVFRMLTRYAERRGFKWELLGSSPNEAGGFKEVTFAIKGDGAYSVFKWEGGTHRVQRVPETESQGRIHTSTATVAVMPEAEEVEVEVDANDLKVDVYRSTGPGRSEREHDRLRRPDHARADRSRRRHAGREVAAPEQAEGDAGAARAPVRAGACEAAGRALRAAPLADRRRRARREDPHLQLPREPPHGPPDQAHGAPARPHPRGPARRVHRGARVARTAAVPSRQPRSEARTARRSWMLVPWR